MWTVYISREKCNVLVTVFQFDTVETLVCICILKLCKLIMLFLFTYFECFFYEHATPIQKKRQDLQCYQLPCSQTIIIMNSDQSVKMLIKVSEAHFRKV